MPDSAIVMYERYLTTPDAFRLAPTMDALYLAFVHERLGDLYEARGDHARALSQYGALVAQWNGADPELAPAVAKIRKRIARLARSGG